MKKLIPAIVINQMTRSLDTRDLKAEQSFQHRFDRELSFPKIDDVYDSLDARFKAQQIRKGGMLG